MQDKYKQLLSHLSPNDLDDDGKLKPSVLFYLILVYLCKPLLVVVMATATFGEDTAKLIANIYPSSQPFVLSSVVAVLAVISLALIGFREKLKQPSITRWIPVFIASLFIPLLLVLDAAPFIQTLLTKELVLSGGPLLMLLFNTLLLYVYLFSDRERVFRWQLRRGEGF